MGEIAEMMIDGVLCAETGEFLGEPDTPSDKNLKVIKSYGFEVKKNKKGEYSYFKNGSTFHSLDDVIEVALKEIKDEG